MALRAQFEIYHEQPDLLDKIQEAYPAVPTALFDSPFFSTNPARNRIVFATATRDVIVICVPASIDQLDVTVETTESDIRQASENAWRTIRRCGRKHKLRIASLTLVDGESGDTVATGTSSWRNAIEQRDLWGVFATAIAEAAWLLALRVAGVADVGLVALGAVPAFGAAVVAVVVMRARARRLYWRVTGWDS